MFLSKTGKHKALPSAGLARGSAAAAGHQVLAGFFTVGFSWCFGVWQTLLIDPAFQIQ